MMPVWFSLTLKFAAIALVAVSVGVWQSEVAGWAAEINLLRAAALEQLSA